MTEDLMMEARSADSTAAIGRKRLLKGAPVREREIDAAGVSTAVLEGGSGEPLLLLHGPGEHALKWLPVLASLVTTNRVIAPELPGHGATRRTGAPLSADQVLAWLGAVIDATCPSPPVVVGQTVGGAIAARYAALHGDRVARLVLVDALGLAPFHPTAEFAAALEAYLAAPDEATFEPLMRRCTHDFDRVRGRMGQGWQPFQDYTLDRVRAPGAQEALGALFEQFILPAMPREILASIRVPVTLIWGRNDLATDLSVAEAASTTYGWPLHVVEDCGDDPVIEQPERFLEVLRKA